MVFNVKIYNNFTQCKRFLVNIQNMIIINNQNKVFNIISGKN